MAGTKSADRKKKVFELFAEGKTPKDPEVKELGLRSKTRYNYFSEFKNQQKSTTPDTTTPDNPKGSTPTPPRVVGKPIEVGKITITPENWGMTQYGAILILDTYNKAKRDIQYGGTIGDFICDMCEFYRRIVNYGEVKYGRERDNGGSEGGGGIEEDGGASLIGIEQAASG